MSIPKPVTLVDSGVEWLGPIPSHWSVRRVRFVAELNPSKSEVSSLAPNTEVSFLPMEAIGEDGSHQLDQVRLLSDVLTGYTFFKDGDVAIAKITPCFENGKGAVMRNLRNGIGFGTTELIVARPRAAATTSSFLHWLFSSHAFRQAGEAFMYGAGGQKRVPDDFVRNFATAFPPLPEQHQVVAFLDRETAKIDALVEEQKRLIELLKEKRQAVISQAVTKGLDPSVPMKDSGVAWLGEVPAHWRVSSIKHIVSTPVTDGPHETPEFPDEGIPFVSAEAVSSGVLDFEKKRGYISVDDHKRYSLKYRPRRGDIYMVKSGATTGVTAIVETDEDFNIWSPLAVIRCNESCDPYFVLNFMRSKNFLEAVTLNWSFGTQQNIGMGVIENLAIPVPPIADQRRIAAALSGVTKLLDALTKQAEDAMRLLKERRSALISAAVTGKIDVRGLVPQPEVIAA